MAYIAIYKTLMKIHKELQGILMENKTSEIWNIILSWIYGNFRIKRSCTHLFLSQVSCGPHPPYLNHSPWVWKKLVLEFHRCPPGWEGIKMSVWETPLSSVLFASTWVWNLILMIFPADCSDDLHHLPFSWPSYLMWSILLASICMFPEQHIWKWLIKFFNS